MTQSLRDELVGVADRAYRVILEPESDGTAYNAIIPAFPHAHTFGATVEEAVANAREVIELEIEVALDGGEDIPASDGGHVVIGTITITPLSLVSRG